jgi:hypothetical protein
MYGRKEDVPLMTPSTLDGSCEACSGWEVGSLPVDSEDDEMDSVCSGDLGAEVSTGEEGCEMG